MKDKFINKFMRLAKEVGTYENPCYSRKIGAVIVNDRNRILGTGYNGPAAETPHTDEYKYLQDFFWPQLTDEEKSHIQDLMDMIGAYEKDLRREFCKKYEGCGICPRRLVEASSGQRTELCSCGHVERHAITNAVYDIHDCFMFCWCGIPCIQCSDAIIQAGITEVHCLEDSDYHSVSKWLLRWGGVQIFEYPKERFEDEASELERTGSN
jgi:deoxycytidylate deaminase